MEIDALLVPRLCEHKGSYAEYMQECFFKNSTLAELLGDESRLLEGTSDLFARLEVDEYFVMHFDLSYTVAVNRALRARKKEPVVAILNDVIDDLRARLASKDPQTGPDVPEWLRP